MMILKTIKHVDAALDALRLYIPDAPNCALIDSAGNLWPLIAALAVGQPSPGTMSAVLKLLNSKDLQSSSATTQLAKELGYLDKIFYLKDLYQNPEPIKERLLALKAEMTGKRNGLF